MVKVNFAHLNFLGSVSRVKFRYFGLPFVDLHGNDVIESDAEDDPRTHIWIVSVWSNSDCLRL